MIDIASPVEKISVGLQDSFGVDTLVSADGEMFDSQLFATQIELALQEPGIWVYHRATFLDGDTLTSQSPHGLDPAFVELVGELSRNIRDVSINAGNFKKIELEIPFDANLSDRLQVFLEKLFVPGYKLKQVDFYTDPFDDNKCAGVVAKGGSSVDFEKIKDRLLGLGCSEGDVVQFEFIFTEKKALSLIPAVSVSDFMDMASELSGHLDHLQDIVPNSKVPRFRDVELHLVGEDESIVLPVLTQNLVDFAEFVCGEWRSTETY